MMTTKGKQAGKLLKMRLTYRKRSGRSADQAYPWRLKIEGTDGDVGFTTMRAAKTAAREKGKLLGAECAAGARAGYRGVTLLVQKKNQRQFQAEFTYPRSADNPRSKG